ncbi:MAG: GspH/FimT family pseudopilin [Pseudomonadota bacterium]|nr:GspH/FimT family pseudopilin [Pseudomonadota bacterium]
MEPPTGDRPRIRKRLTEGIATNNQRQSGFSLIELLITIAVAAIVLGVGVPNFVSLVRSNRTVTEVNNLVAAIHLARSEAVGRGIEVRIAPQDPVAATGACVDPCISGWVSGWIVGIDLNGNRNFTDPGDTVLRIFEAVDSLQFTDSPASIEFTPLGGVAALASFTIVPAHCNDTNNRQRVLNVALAGTVDLLRRDCPGGS